MPLNIPANVLNDRRSRENGVRVYTNADVGLRGDRPFRVCTARWDRPGENVPPGDDPDASLLSSRVLEIYAYDMKLTRELDVPLHAHEFYEFAFIRGSTGNRHWTEEGETELVRGRVVILMPGAIHGYRPMGGLHKTDLYLQPNWLSNELRLLWREEGLIRMLLTTSLFEYVAGDGLWEVQLDEDAFAACERELDTIHEEAKRSKPSLTLFMGCFLKLLSIVNREYMKSEAPIATLHHEAWRIVVALEDLIDRGARLEPDDLARTVGLSRRQLDRVFSSATGLSLSQYYRNRRVQHAARMLSEPGSSVKEIAFDLNFSDTAHFIRVFRERMGVTPGDYRRQHLERVAAPGQAP